MRNEKLRENTSTKYECFHAISNALAKPAEMGITNEKLNLCMRCAQVSL